MRDKYNDSEDGLQAPRNIEEALQFTLQEALMRGVTELRQVFEETFSEEVMAKALTQNELNLEKTILCLQEMSDCTADSPRREQVIEPVAANLDNIDPTLFPASTTLLEADLSMTGIALDFSSSPLISRPPSVKSFLIPDEVVRMILTCLSGKEAIGCGRVCRSWSNVERRCANLYKRECQELWKRIENVSGEVTFPFPFNRLEMLWGADFPDAFLPTKAYIEGFRSWRNMFLTRPRLYLSGVYVSRTKYLRTGSTEGVYVNPVHEVVYYRYFKFYEEGTLVCLTSCEKPAKVIPELGMDTEKVRKGVWMVREGELLAHAVEGNNVFSYRFKLTSSKPYKHDLLRLKECSVRSSSSPAPLRMDNSGNSFPRFFRYFPG